jgi:hypothetical protein
MAKSRNYVGRTQPAAELQSDGPSTSGRSDDSFTAGPQKYLCYFLHRYLDFRVAEVNSLASLAGCKPGEVSWEEPFGGDWMSPFWYITLPSPAAAFEIAKKAVLVRVSERSTT